MGHGLPTPDKYLRRGCVIRLMMHFAFLAWAVHVVAFGAARPTGAATPSFAQPAISPNGLEIAFVSGGDIWVVPAGGGDARLLVAHAANEERPLYSPDGTRVAFMSNRAGSPDIWVLTLATGQVARVTWDDGVEFLDAWSPDGAWIYFSANGDVYRVRAAGGTPMPVAADREIGESMAAPAPDGRAITIVARGNAVWDWWRRGRAHIDETELWRVRIDGPTPQYDKVAPRGAKQLWPMASADGRSLFFVSDRTGPQNLWVKPADAEARAVTSFTSGRVLWPTMARTGQIAFERDFGVWLYDAATSAVREVPIALRGASIGDSIEHLTLTSNFSNLAVAPDGKKIAFVARGEVFAASAADGGDALRVTRTAGAEDQPAWSPHSRALVYTANRIGQWQLFLYDFDTHSETPLTNGAKNANLPRFSPDGQSVAFIRDSTELCVVALSTREIRVVATGFFGRPPIMSHAPIAWSPDSKWIAYLSAGAKMFQNAWIVPATGGESRQATWLADVFAWPYIGTLSWSNDGTFLLLSTTVRYESGQLLRVDLVPRTPRFREDQFAALFQPDAPRPAAPSAPADSTGARPPVEVRRDVRIVFDGIRQRLSVVPVGLDVGSSALAPDGRTVVLTATVGGQPNVFLYSLDDLAAEPAVTRQLTTTTAGKSAVQFSGDSKSVWYLEGGRPMSMALDSRVAKPLAVRAELDVEFDKEKWEVFHQAWEYLNENFYDAAFHGTDWNAVHVAYAPRIAGARTPDEILRIMSLMVGELNASHLGFGAGPPYVQPVIGRLGLVFERTAYESHGEFRVSAVVPLGPADVAGSIRKGDVLLEVNGAKLEAATNLNTMLAYTIGKKVTLVVAADTSGRDRRTVSVRPVVSFDDNTLRYRAWVEERRAMVTRQSGGRLGYVHIFNMGGAAPAQFNLTLDAENQQKDGVVLDVRNNGGGSTNGHVLDFLMRKSYVEMVLRGVPAVSGRYLLGQRTLQAPTILITNQGTVSDAENFTEGYRVLKLGKIVGEPTAGADIYTTTGIMVDGSFMRIPYMRSAQLDLAALELVPRSVDVPIDRPMGESYTGRDVQLETAVNELIAQLGPPKARSVLQQ